MSSQNNEIPEGFKMTELGLLPEEWDLARLGKVVNVYDKQRIPLRSEDRQSMQGDFPYCGANGIIDHINQYLFDGEFVLLAEDGGYWHSFEESSYVMNGKFWVNNHAHILAAIVGKADNYYLMYVLNYLDISVFIGGTTRGKLTQGLMKAIPISLPPLPEQKAIARVLSTIQKAIEAQDKIIAAARELKKSLMSHLFTYGPVPVAEAEKVPLKETEIGPVPEHWEVVRLDSVKAPQKGAIVSGPFGSNIGKRFFMSSGVPVIRGNNLTTGRLRFIDNGFVYLTEEKASEFSYCEAIPGDVVFTAAGTIGQLGIVPQDGRFRKYIISNKQMRIRLNTELTFPDFIFYWFTTPTGQNEIISERRGTSIPVINLSILRNLLMPLPPIPIQHEIVLMLSNVDNKIEAEEKRKVAFQALFKTMLHQLMTGKIKVKDLEVTAA